MKDKIHSGKIARTKLTGFTAAKVSAKHLSYMGKRIFQSKKSREESKELHEKEIGQMIMATLSQLRGAALKVSQMLSTEVDLLPESIRKELAKSCYNVAPLNRALVRKVFLEEFGVAPEKLFKTFDSQAFAAASLGQVHNAESSEGQELAIKIQYPGIASSIENDIKIVRKLTTTLSDLTNYLPKKDLIHFVMDEIEQRLVEEVDYYHEAESTKWFYENNDHPDVIVPKVISKFSGKRVICFDKLEGLHLNEWLENNPTQDERNHYGQILFDLFWKSIFETGRLHADPHQGNYLFMSDGKLAVLDYGCTVKLSEDFPKAMKEVLNAHLCALRNGDEKRIFEGYKALKVISDEESFDNYDNGYREIFKNFQTWFTAPYLVEEYDFSNAQSYPIQTRELTKKMSKSIDGVYRDQVYFDRSYMGLISILRTLKAKVHCRTKYLGPYQS